MRQTRGAPPPLPFAWPYFTHLSHVSPPPPQALHVSLTRSPPSFLQAALHEYSWLVSDAYARLSPDALGGATDEQFQWAMSLLHR